MSIPSNSQRSLGLFGSVLALILLCLYTGIISYMLYKVMQNGGDENFPPFGSGLVYIVTTVGGLISALVIGKLAVSDPSEPPVMMKMTAGEAETDRLATLLSYIYLGTWVTVGLSSLLVGTIFYPNTSSTVSDIGTTWLGLAITSSYAFFGIQPTGGNGGA